MRILILAPHTDDGELGCGGVMAKTVRNGGDVLYVALSHKFSDVDLADECQASLKRLGVFAFQLQDFPARVFSDHRQMILDSMIYTRKKYEPEVVFVPSSSDFHQDHAVVHNEAIRAFRDSTVLGYDLPWCKMVQGGTVIVPLEEVDLVAKVEALAEYKSQEHRKYMRPDFIRSLAVVTGTKIGIDFAESFEALRIIPKLEI